MQSAPTAASVLIVDDEPALLRVHGRALAREGYLVETAPDGSSAELAIKRTSFDVIFSDIDMPGMDGLTLLERLRVDHPDVPVVFVTGAPSLASAIKAIDLGAMRYLVKPVPLPLLLEVANEAVQLHRATKTKRQRGLIVGSTVDGRYELRRDLGRGAAGMVFEARHVYTGRSVALKVMSPDVPHSRLAETRARLGREARALASVRHPGIVEVLDGGVLDDGTPYIAMDLLDGRTLEGLLTTRGKLSSDETIALALQACEALGAVHAAGIVHRDLKPSNLLVVREYDGHERIKLVDFGIAQLATPTEEKLTSVGALIGTAAYMAPEQLCALPDIDCRADLYALGVTMFECLSGDVPYRGNYPKILMQVSAPTPVPSLPASVDPKLAAIVARAMAKQRDERFATADDFARALRAALSKTAPRATLLGPASVPGPAPAAPAQRRRFTRAPYRTPVNILLPDGTIDGRSEDISEGGLLVICRARCDNDVTVNVRFALPIEGRIVSCEAQLRWLREAQPGVPDGPRALGLKFVNPPDALITSVKQYVALMGGGARPVSGTG